MRNLKFLLLSAFLFRLVISTSIYSGDLNNHTGWGKSILKLGFSGAYDRQYSGIMQPTYPPIAIYAFTTSVGLYDLIYSTSRSLNNSIPIFPSPLIWALENENVLPAFTKVVAWLSDIGVGVCIYYLVRKVSPARPRLALITAGLYLFNPAVWYTSALWGQIETLPLFSLLVSLLMFSKNRPHLSALAFTSALLSKQSMIIFIPIFIIIYLKKFGSKPALISLASSLIFWITLYLPYMRHIDLLWPFSIYLDRIRTGSGSVWITDHAFNPWIWVSRLEKIPDSTPVAGPFSAQLIGYFLFSLAFLPVIVKLYHRRLNLRLTLLSCTVVPMLSFVLLTKMHERYFAPAIPFLAVSSTFSPFLWPVYILSSFAHLLNLYHNWYFPRLTPLDDWVASWSTIEITAIIFTLSAFVVFLSVLVRRKYN